MQPIVHGRRRLSCRKQSHCHFLSTVPDTSSPSRLHLRDWPLPSGRALRGMAVLVHGLGEHSGRQATLARQLVEAGFAVRSYDHHGHGASPGKRGDLLQPGQLLQDLGGIIDGARQQWGARTPLLLCGHSLGGLVAARWASQQPPGTVQGLLLSSPALATHIPRRYHPLLHWLGRVAPHLNLPNGLPPEQLSHDPQVVRDYLADPLVHDRISASLTAFLLREGPATLQQASRWQTPTLLLYADPDAFVDAAGSRALASLAPPGVVQAHSWSDCGHELFHELPAVRNAAFACLHAWLDRHF